MTEMRKTALGLTIVLGLFILAMVAALIVMDQREKTSGVLALSEMAPLKEKFVKAPKDPAIQEAIRKRDLELREDYFRNRRRFKAGSYLLALALIGWVTSARWFFALAPEVPPEILMERLSSPGARRKPKPGRNALAIGGVTVVLLLWIALAGTVRRDTFPLPSTSQVKTAPAKLVAKNANQKTGAAQTTPVSATPALPAAPTPRLSPKYKENWPCFRGPGNLGLATAADWPTTWSVAASQHVLWKTELPIVGKSSPVVWADRIFLTGGDEKERRVLCLDRESGKILWNTPVAPPPQADASKINVFQDTGFAAPSPVTDGLRVYAMFATGTLAAFDFEGKQVWIKQLGIPESTYGFASSLMLHDNILILQFDQGSEAEAKKSKLLGIDPATGKVLWTTPRDVPNSWASPAIIKTANRLELITCAAPWVIAYDPAKGSELWRLKGLDGDVAPSPAFGGGLIVVSNDRAQTLAIRPGGSGDVTATNIAWKGESGMPDIVSPLTDGKFALLVTNGGQLTCHDLQTGNKLWEEYLEGSFSSSPILAGKYVYLTGEDGVTRIIELGGKYQLKAHGEVGEPVHATPAFADTKLYIRGDKHMFCIGNKP